MKIIGLCGYAQSGKDAAAQALTDIGWTRVSFADPLRKALLAIDPIVCPLTVYEYERATPLEPEIILSRKWWLPWTWFSKRRDVALRLSGVVSHYGWEAAKRLPEVRRLLQRLGTEAGRDIHGEFCWTRIAGVSIDSAIAAGTAGIVVTDCRFENEVQCLKRFASREGFQVHIVRVTRPGVGPVNGHISDTAIDKLNCDVTIANDGAIAELHHKIIAIAAEKSVVTA